jgi:hypothetical protein
MDNVVKSLRILQVAMLVSIVLYIGILVRLAPQISETPRPVFLIAIMFLSVLNVGGILVIRRLVVARAEAALRNNPADAPALVRWRAGYIATYAIAESVALFGLVLRFIGFSLAQAAPFFVAALVLILFFGPRRRANAVV